jgi:hypothetical protein
VSERHSLAFPSFACDGTVLLLWGLQQGEARKPSRDVTVLIRGHVSHFVSGCDGCSRRVGGGRRSAQCRTAVLAQGLCVSLTPFGRGWGFGHAFWLLHFERAAFCHA